MASIFIQPKDGDPIPISEKALAQSITLQNLVENLGTSSDNEDNRVILPVEQFSRKILELIVKWCEKHCDEPVVELPKTYPLVVVIPEWDQNEIFENIDNQELFDLTLAANFLDIPTLLGYCSKKIGSFGHHKSTEEMRRIYGISE